MSELVKDKSVIDNGRKAPLKDVDAPLRDQIVDKLYKKLEEDEMGQKLVSVWSGGNAERTNWLERQRAYLQSWDEHLVQDTEGAFKGSSNLHIPMPFIVAKTMHARFLQATMSVDPPFNMKARNEASMERVSVVSDTLRYALADWSNHYKGIDATMDRWLWSWITTGVGLKKWRWDVRYERYIDVVEVPKPQPPKFVVGPDGHEQVVPQPPLMVEEESPVTKKVFEGPVCENIHPEDLLIIGGGGDPDLADNVIQYTELTASDLWTLADRKIFKYDVVEEVIGGGQDSSTASGNQAIKLQRSVNAGKATTDTEQDLDKYGILECYFKYDADGSGINSEVVAWVHNRSKKILRATYLRRVSASGERPFAKADFHLRDDQEYGTGLIEMLYPLSKELDAIHNMRLDFGLISVMPFGFYRATSGLDPSTIQLEPGALIPVDNPQSDVYFPNLGNRTVFGMQEESAIDNLIQRMTSISELNMGVQNGSQGATRTATGARALVGEMSSNLDVYLRRLNRGWRKSLRYLLHMLQQRLPKGLEFRLTGEDGQDYFRTIKDEKDLAGDFDIELNANSSTSNKGIQQDNAQQIMQMTSNPLDIQLGIVNASNRYEALKNFYQALGIKDYRRFCNQPDPDFSSKRLSPEEEANRILHGMSVKVVPEMDHQGFIDYFQHIHDTDELAGYFQQHEFVALAAQAKKHEQMMKSLQAMQAQQANASQMQQNAAQSQQQAPVGMNAQAKPQPAPQGGMPGGPQ